MCWGTYRTAGEALAKDPRVSLANPVFESTDTVGVGPHMTAGSAVRVANAQRMPTPPAPLLGADTDAVLNEVLGLDSKDYEFSRATMTEHWRAGERDVCAALSHPELLQGETVNGVTTFDLARLDAPQVRRPAGPAR